MERSKKTDNAAGTKVNRESKIPKSTKWPSAKEVNSMTSIKRKTALSSKNSTKMTTTTSSKLKQTQLSKVPKNAKRMSVVKISNDVMNHFRDENDPAIESTAGLKVLNSENAIKRAPLKDQFPQASQKQSGNLPKRASAPDLKQNAAFGGIKFIKKKNTCPKFDMFPKMAKESKDNQAVILSDSSVKRIGTIPRSAKGIKSEVETITIEETSLNEVVNLPSEDANYLTPAPTAVKELDKLYPGFAGMRLKPKRKSTHPKPDIFVRAQEELKIRNEDSDSPGSSSEAMKMATGATNEMSKTETKIFYVETLEKTSTQNAGILETASITVKETSRVIAFSGTPFAPKWKSTPIRPKMLENLQKEAKTDCLEVYPTDSTSKEFKTDTEKVKMKVETDDEKLKLLKTQKPESSKNDEASKNVKKVIPPAFGGLRFKPRQKKLHDIFGDQKSKVHKQTEF